MFKNGKRYDMINKSNVRKLANREYESMDLAYKEGLHRAFTERRIGGLYRLGVVGNLYADVPPAFEVVGGVLRPAAGLDKSRHFETGTMVIYLGKVRLERTKLVMTDLHKVLGPDGKVFQVFSWDIDTEEVKGV